MANKLVYSYEKVSENENFDNFINLINNKIPIKLIDWYKILGFKEPTGLRVFLKRYNLKYIINRNKTIELDAETIRQIKLDYKESKLTLVAIAAKHNIGYNDIYKYIDSKQGRRIRGNTIKSNLQHNIGIESTQFGQMKLLLEKNNVKFEIIHNGLKSLFKVNCCECGKTIVIGVERFRSRLKSDAKIKCYKCWVTNHYAPNAPMRKLNPKINTSGYVGISVKSRTVGFRATIQYKNKVLLCKTYKDETLSDKTLMEAVVEREKFIIRNGLPHTRNLTDVELFSNMEMLGQYSDLGLIKEDLKEYYTILKLDKGV